jgi:thioredoxin 1
MLKQTTDATFKQDVLESTKPAVVDFWAPWCEPCKRIKPLLEKAALSHKDHVVFYTLNIDENPQTPSQHQILSIPTLILFQDGKSKDMRVGLFQDAQEIADWLKASA